MSPQLPPTTIAHRTGLFLWFCVRGSGSLTPRLHTGLPQAGHDFASVGSMAAQAWQTPAGKSPGAVASDRRRFMEASPNTTAAPTASNTKKAANRANTSKKEIPVKLGSGADIDVNPGGTFVVLPITS